MIVRKVKTFPIEQALSNGLVHPEAPAMLLMVGLTLGFVGVIYALSQLRCPLSEEPQVKP